MKYEPASAGALLAGMPSVLRALLAGLPDACLEAPEGPDARSRREVACHLVDLELDGWLPRVHMILEHGGGQPRAPVDRERFRESCSGAAPEEVLADFASA